MPIRVPLGALSMEPEPPTTQTMRVPLGALTAPTDLSTPAAEPTGMIKDSPIDTLKGLWSFINPIPAVKAIVTAYRDMPDWEKAVLGPTAPLAPLVKGMATAEFDLLKKGKRAFDAGRYSEMLGYLTAAGLGATALLPGAGPGVAVMRAAAGPLAAHIGETAGEGNVYEAAGQALALGVPAALSKVKSVPLVPAVARNQNPAERAAVAFGESRGVPIDAATATGNPAVRGAQYLADRSLGGSVVGTRATRQTHEALTRVGNELAADVHPLPVSPEQAGQAVRTGVAGKVSDFAAEATTAYDTLRTLEAQAPPQTRSVRPGQPVQSMRMAVDLRPSKAVLQPIYDRLKREAELVPLQGDKARALTSLDRLMNGPEFQPLSVVDEALGDLKAFTRQGRAGEMPVMKTAGQGAIAQAVQNLDAAVMSAATKEGPKAVNALLSGRKATVAKYAADEILQSLTDEPVRVFNQATWAKDAGIEKLRDVQKLAPEALPQLGRAYLEDLLSTATAEGGFGRTPSIWTKWSNLGPETKRLLFGNPSNATNLDQFFLLAKKLQENPNPSGSAYGAALTGQGAYLWFDPVAGTALQITAAGLSKLLHSPRAVRVLTDGLRIGVSGKKAAAATTASELAAIAHELGVPVSRVAERPGETPPATAAR